MQISQELALEFDSHAVSAAAVTGQCRVQSTYHSQNSCFCCYRRGHVHGDAFKSNFCSSVNASNTIYFLNSFTSLSFFFFFSCSNSHPQNIFNGLLLSASRMLPLKQTAKRAVFHPGSRSQLQYHQLPPASTIAAVDSLTMTS